VNRRWKGKERNWKEYKYLGYTVHRKQDKQIRERVTKAVMGVVWGIEKKRFEKDWRRRIWLFNRLWTIVGYGIEIWGWKEREAVEKLHE